MVLGGGVFMTIQVSNLDFTYVYIGQLRLRT